MVVKNRRILRLGMAGLGATNYSGVCCEPHRIAPRCPWGNGYAERFIRSLKESVLRKCLFTSESALRLALDEFQAYFNHERPHQGIDNRTVLGSSDVPTSTENVVRIPRVGGLLNHYERVRDQKPTRTRVVKMQGNRLENQSIMLGHYTLSR